MGLAGSKLITVISGRQQNKKKTLKPAGENDRMPEDRAQWRTALAGKPRIQQSQESDLQVEGPKEDFFQTELRVVTSKPSGGETTRQSSSVGNKVWVTRGNREQRKWKTLD